MSAAGHYVTTKDGPVWVGPTRGEVAALRAKLAIARGALREIHGRPRDTATIRDIAADALRRSEP